MPFGYYWLSFTVAAFLGVLSFALAWYVFIPLFAIVFFVMTSLAEREGWIE